MLLCEVPLRYEARVTKAIDNSGDREATYHYYYNGQAPAGQAGQVIETRNNATVQQVLKQHVWGIMYVDELLQIGINQDPKIGERPLFHFPYFLFLRLTPSAPNHRQST